MGPRLVSRGNCRPPAYSWRSPRRFNGAAARQPRKRRELEGWKSSSEELQWGRGSSAAETCARRRHGITGRASMGPRLVSRGNFSPGPGPARCVGFNGAAARQPRKRGSATMLMPQSTGFNGAAARQPRKRGYCRHIPESVPASMGPRLVSRGNSANPAAQSSHRMRLQWGRGSSAAETPPIQLRNHRTGCGFNGAAARQPRKRPAEPTERMKEAELQWGRGSSAAETGGYKYRQRIRLRLQWGRGSSAAETWGKGEEGDTLPASMGPRLVSRGNDSIVCNALTIAASMGPRLVSRGNLDGGRDAGDLHRASMGPRLVSRGNAELVLTVDLAGLASMGPRLVSRGNWGWPSSMPRTIRASMGPRLVSRGNLRL